MIGEHKTTNLVAGLDIGAFLGQRHLDGGRAPLDELGELAFPDALERLVDLPSEGALPAWRRPRLG